MKTLCHYITVIENLIIEKSIISNPPISGIFNDSRSVINNSIFVAINGSCSNGHTFIENAIDLGATIIIHSEPVVKEKNISYIHVSDSYSAYALLSEYHFDYPSKKFKTIGITGTNGKTTTAYIIKFLLELNKFHCGFLSTVEYSDGQKSIPASHTTPEPYQLQQCFTKISKNNCSHTVMEVSSHSLDQNRIGSTKFASTIFTNLTGDHLDYHLDMESYFNAKVKLFAEHLDSNGKAIVNLDDKYGKKIIATLGADRIITYGESSDCFCQIKNINQNSEGSEITISFEGKNLVVKTNLIGKYNAFNICAAICSLYSLGINLSLIIESINNNIINIPGRMEMIQAPNCAKIFIDYAHTDDALKHALMTLKNICRGKLYLIFGCGGDRDRSKRVRMGRVASEYADSIIITDDNPRTESPETIIKDILKGISSMDALIIHNRKYAIESAISKLTENDTLLIAGKGHETYQEIDGVRTYFNDCNTVNYILKNIKL